MRRYLALLVLLSLSIVTATGVLLAQRRGSEVRPKGPPTFFDKRVEGAFFKDVLRAHGPGTIDSLGTPRAKTIGPGNKKGGTPAGGDGTWDNIVSAETLNAEINSGINQVQKFVGNRSDWNKGHRKVRTSYNIMAMCFGVITQHGGEVKYKKQAATLRDALARSSANSKTNSEGAMKEAKTRLDELKDLRNGGSITLNEEAEPIAPFAAVGPLSEIMKRISAAHETGENGHLKAWTADAATFKANKGDILHEAEIVAMLAKVMQDKSYELAAEEGFVNIAKQVEGAGKKIAEAVKLDNHNMAQEAVGVISKACTDCHGEYQ